MKKISAMLLLFVLSTTAVDAQQLRHRPRYTLHVGDELTLQYRYTPELNQTVSVQPDGYVNLNLVGDVKVSELTVTQAHDLIVEKAKTHLNDPELNLILKDFQQPYIVVAGEVPKPGKLYLNENTSALQAVLLSGGFMPSSQKSQVLLFRKINTDTAEIRVLNLGKFKTTADLERDIELEPGDMLFVPKDKVEKVARDIKLANLGMYVNPLASVQ
jgi:polysaccharide export outer membrane protein